MAVLLAMAVLLFAALQHGRSYNNARWTRNDNAPYFAVHKFQLTKAGAVCTSEA